MVNAAALLSKDSNLGILSSAFGLFVTVKNWEAKVKAAEERAYWAGVEGLAAVLESEQTEEASTDNNQGVNQCECIVAGIREFLSDKVLEIQKNIDRIEEKVKNNKELSKEEISYMLSIYEKIIIGGYIAGLPEASKLLERYFNPSNALGKYISDPLKINPKVYKSSIIVQYAMEQMKSIISLCYFGDEFGKYAETDSSILKSTS